MDGPLVHGARAEVKYDTYFTAAVLTGWSLTIDPTTRLVTFAATVDTADHYLLTQSPLELVLHGRRPARWGMVSHRIVDQQFVANLGVLEKPKGTPVA